MHLAFHPRGGTTEIGGVLKRTPPYNGITEDSPTHCSAFKPC